MYTVYTSIYLPYKSLQYIAIYPFVTMSLYINKSKDSITQSIFYNNIQYMASFHITFHLLFHMTIFIFYLIMVSIISIHLFLSALFLFSQCGSLLDLEKGFKTSTCYIHNYNSMYLPWITVSIITSTYHSICVWDFITCYIFSFFIYSYKTLVQLV